MKNIIYLFVCTFILIMSACSSNHNVFSGSSENWDGKVKIAYDDSYLEEILEYYYNGDDYKEITKLKISFGSAYGGHGDQTFDLDTPNNQKSFIHGRTVNNSKKIYESYNVEIEWETNGEKHKEILTLEEK